MKRRSLLALALAAAVAPAAAFADDFIEYKPGVIENALADGKTVFVDFSATWCSTCKRQERVINALRADNPAYDDAFTFVQVDWDTYSRHEVTTSRAIPRSRSAARRSEGSIPSITNFSTILCRRVPRSRASG